MYVANSRSQTLCDLLLAVNGRCSSGLLWLWDVSENWGYEQWGESLSKGNGQGPSRGVELEIRFECS